MSERQVRKTEKSAAKPESDVGFPTTNLWSCSEESENTSQPRPPRASQPPAPSSSVLPPLFDQNPTRLETKTSKAVSKNITSKRQIQYLTP